MVLNIPFWGQKRVFKVIEIIGMARAKRYFVPGYVWHITHRCHKKDFLMKFVKDRERWTHWLFQAKKRHGLHVLNYMATSNHIHLLVIDKGGRDVIPNSASSLPVGQLRNTILEKIEKEPFGKTGIMRRPFRLTSI